MFNICSGQSELHLESVCRLCLSSVYPVKNVFSTQILSGELVYQVMNYVIGLEITLNDPLPPNICQPCLWKVTAFFEFKRNAFFAKSRLIEIVGELRKGRDRKEAEYERKVTSNSPNQEQLLANFQAVKEEPCTEVNDDMRNESDEDEIENAEWKVPEVHLAVHDSMRISVEENNKYGLGVSAVKHEEPGTTMERIEVGTSQEECFNEQVQQQNLLAGQEMSLQYREQAPYQLHQSVSEMSHLESKNSIYPIGTEYNNAEVGHWLQQDRNSGANDSIQGNEMRAKTSRIDENVIRKPVLEGVNEEDIVICYYCGERRKTKSELKEHIDSIHFSSVEMKGKEDDPNKEKTFKCTFCQNLFKTRKELRKHLKDHTGVIHNNRLMCFLCKKTYKNRNGLVRHLKTHAAEKMFQCSYCEYSTSYSKRFDKHVRMHTGEKYKCNVCDYSTPYPTLLKIHIRKHTGEKPYKCNLCEYRASQRHSLNLHIISHTGENPHKCQWCSYSTANSQHLKEHILRHTGEKPHKCHICDYSAALASNLKKHLRTHTGERPYKCNVCNYSAAQAVCLRQHMRTHTGERPFKCNMCEYSAAQATTLKQHIQSHIRKKV